MTHHSNRAEPLGYARSLLREIILLPISARHAAQEAAPPRPVLLLSCDASRRRHTLLFLRNFWHQRGSHVKFHP